MVACMSRTITAKRVATLLGPMRDTERALYLDLAENLRLLQLEFLHEHREIACCLLKMQAGQREQGFEGAELFAAPRRDFGGGGDEW